MDPAAAHAAPARRSGTVSPSTSCRSTSRRLLAVVGLLPLVLLGCTADPEPDEGQTAAPEETSEETPEETEAPSPEETDEPAPEETEDEEPDEPEQTPDPEAPVLTQQGVTAAHPEAVAVGEAVLAQGGNAVDAAVATAFAISVVEPFASGIGGGGAAILAGPDLDPVTYDYREQVAEDGRIPDSGTGVPGFAAGMEQIHAEHGALPWEQLLTGARDLAADGFEVSPFLELRMRSDFGPAAVEGSEHFAPDGEPLEAGEELVQTDLADTMDRLAEHGAEDLYTGSLAEELTAVDGLDAATLEGYEVITSEPAAGALGEHELLSAAPPLPGAAIIQQVQLAEAAGTAEMTPGGPDHVIALAESWETARETAENQIGDPRFVEVPLEEITDAETNGVGADAASGAVADVGVPDASDASGSGDMDPAARSTTHLAVVDEDGLTVSMTNTITNFWGSGETVGGFFLNNQLSRFDAVDSPANQPEPGRRSVSWSAPSMVLDGEGRPVLALGTPGGPQIPTILTEVLTRWGLQGQSLGQAVEAPRSHLDDDVLHVEGEPDHEVAAAVEEQGWEIDPMPPEQAFFGSVQALEIDYESGTVTGADDTRREGAHSILD